MTDLTPELIKVRAIDIVPYEHAIWCTVADSKPFANTIEHRSWSEDGQHIWLMLGTHNFYKAAPDDLVEVVRVCEPGAGYKSKSLFADGNLDNAVFMAKRPAPALSPEQRAERIWESLNVAEFPGLEDPNGLKNARWGCIAGYLAALKEKS